PRAAAGARPSVRLHGGGRRRRLPSGVESAGLIESDPRAADGGGRRRGRPCAGALPRRARRRRPRAEARTRARLPDREPLHHRRRVRPRRRHLRRSARRPRHRHPASVGDLGGHEPHLRRRARASGRGARAGGDRARPLRSRRD
ncbi:hypothetical protein OY671_013058, partial [Metschnikowia pulcherrima]